MVPQFNFEAVDVPKIVDGITALLVGPVILTVAEGINQPFVKTAIKEGIAFSERSQEAMAEVRERFEDLVAEVQAELAEERQAKSNADGQKIPTPGGQSETATGVMSAMAELNERVRWMTNGAADLRLLLPLGLGALALRQVLDKGFELEEIPWYTLAWYAFDSFVKLHNSGEVQQPTKSQPRLFRRHGSHRLGEHSSQLT